ncbi:MAG TPA: hypothetical protein VL688_06660 [Verrucomicrobiae bacterium]|nr:hypothetical protein [Verrucomicrobiae bacterium]
MGASISFVLFYAALGAGLGPFSSKIFQYARENGGKYGTKLMDPRYESVRLASWNAVEWGGISARFKSLRKGSLLEEKVFRLQADRVRLKLLNFFTGRCRIEAEGVELLLEKGTAHPRVPGRLAGDMSYEFRLDLVHPGIARKQIRELFRAFSSLVHEGMIAGKLEFRGNSAFSIKGKTFEAVLFSEPAGPQTRLVMEPGSIRNVALVLGDSLTPSEIDLLSQHPFLAPRLFEIQDYVREKAETLNAQGKASSKDAYKHILWSYLLTREYGPDFAKVVTDAHENGSATNTAADHKMDFNNNIVGRRYALSGIPESGLLSRMLQDPSVIQHPE